MVVGFFVNHICLEVVCELNKTKCLLPPPLRPSCLISPEVPRVAYSKCKCSLIEVSVTLLCYLSSSWFQGTFTQSELIGGRRRRRRISVARATGGDSSRVAGSESCEAAVIFQMLNPALGSLFLLLTGRNPPLLFFACRPTQPAAVRDVE